MTPLGGDEPASTTLERVRDKIHEYMKLPPDYFNVILANKYAHGGEYVGWHSDDLKALGKDPVIASLSVGACRSFLVREKKSKRTVYQYLIDDGSLLIMSGKMQSFYHHCVPKVSQKKCDKMRLNFTFRRVEN